MSVLKRLGGRLPDFGEVAKRFPIAIIVMAGFTVWLIIQNLTTSYIDDEYTAGGFILAGYVAVLLRLMGEARHWPKLRTTALQIVAVLIAFCLGNFARTIDFNIPMAVGAAILFLGNASAWRRGRDDSQVWSFTQKLWTGAIFATLGSIIFALGIFAITQAVEMLFGVNLESLTEDIVLPIGLAFLAPLYWLGTLPSVNSSEQIEELSFEARALSFLGTWMLAPLVSVYALIILAYGVKILIQWDLPKGEIGTLVTPFLGIGMLVWLMLEPKILNESGFVRFYRKVWHWVMIPAAVMLGIAVFVRVQAYGFTIERVFLLLVALWALVQGLWFTVLPKVKRDIRVPTAIAAIILAAGAFVAEPLSLNSQFQRAKAAKAELPVFTATTIKANPEIGRQFLGGMEYLVRKKDEARFKRLLPDRDLPKSVHSSEWRDIKTSLGLDEIEDNRSPRRVSYTVSTSKNIPIPSESQFIGSYELSLPINGRSHLLPDYLDSSDDYNVVFSLDEKQYQIDLLLTLNELELVGGNDQNKDVFIAPITLRAEDGSEAILLILSGYMATYDEKLNHATFQVAFIIPN